jgi:hypothetical protein
LLRIGYQARSLARIIAEGHMDVYAAEVERMMKRLFDSLKENDRRRYAAIEAAKLGHGGLEYVASVLGCDPKTIRVGLVELEGEDVLDTSRSRKKGVDANG